MDASSDDSFALSWCTLDPEPITKPPPKTFTILIGDPAAPKKLECHQGLIKSQSQFFRNILKSSAERRQNTVFGIESQNPEAAPSSEPKTVDKYSSEPQAVDNPSSEPQACFREALDKMVDLTWADPTALVDYFKLVEYHADFLRHCWPRDANGLDAIFKAYLLADYFMDTHTRRKAILVMERIMGVVPLTRSKHSKRPISTQGYLSESRPSTFRYRLIDCTAIVPSLEFIWFVYDATVSLSSTSQHEHIDDGDEAGVREPVRDEARQFLINYFATTGMQLPDPRWDLPEGYKPDMPEELDQDLSEYRPCFPEEFERDLWERFQPYWESFRPVWGDWKDHDGNLVHSLETLFLCKRSLRRRYFPGSRQYSKHYN